MGVLLDLAFFVAGAALVFGFVRWWQPGMRLGLGVGHAALALLFWSPGLLTSGHQVATDFAYLTLPFREAAEPGFRPANPLLSDPVLQFLPFRHLVRERLLAGEAPLWAHELGTGLPLLANAQSAPFAPLFLLLLPLPPLRAMEVAAPLQTLLGLLLGHALLRRLGASHGASAFAALAYAFSSFSVAWAFFPHAMTAMWIPGVLLGVVSLAQRLPRSFAGLVLCALGMALSGHPETLAFGAIAAAVTGVAVLAGARPAARPALAASLLLAALLAFALASPVLLPILDALPRSERMALIAERPEAVAPPPFRPRLLALALDPLHLGRPIERSWRGPGNYNEMATFHAGAAALALAVVGALGVRGRLLWIAIGGALAAALALRLGPAHAVFTALPLLGDAAYGRLRLLYVLAVAIAGGLALDEIARRPATRGGLRVASAAALAATALGLVWLRPDDEAGWASVWRAGSILGLGLLGVACFERRFPPQRLPALAVLVLAFDLGLLGFPYNPRVRAEYGLGPPLPDSIAFLIREDARHAAPFRVVADGHMLTPNLASLYGLWDARVYDVMRPVALARAVTTLLGDDRGHASLAIRYRLTPRCRGLPSPWSRVHHGPGGCVWRNDAALPLFFFPRHVEPLGDDSEDARILDEDFAERVRVAGTRTSGVDAPGGVQQGEATLTETTGNGLRIAVASPTGGLVASSVSWDPGWRLELDGEPAPTVVVNGAFLGFEVSPGPHVAVFDYAPRSWRLGLALTGLATVSTLAWVAWTRVGRPYVGRFGSSGPGE
jgi:hypothetical protein